MLASEPMSATLVRVFMLEPTMNIMTAITVTIAAISIVIATVFPGAITIATIIAFGIADIGTTECSKFASSAER